MSTNPREVYEEAGYPSGMNCVADFIDAFGLVRELTPFQPWGDVFDEFRRVREYVESEPRTSATFSIRALNTATGLDRTPSYQRATAFLRALGSWQVDMGSSWSTRWANPTYIHDQTLNHLAEEDERREYLQVAASFGFPRAEHIQTAFGVGSMKDATYHIDGVVWEDARREGLKALARTIQVANEWLDRTIGSLMSDLDVPRRSYHEWCTRYDLRDFDVPKDPYKVYDSFDR